MSNLRKFDTNVHSFDDVRRALDTIKLMLRTAESFVNYDRVIGSTEARVIEDTYSAVAVRYLSIEAGGSLELQGDAALEVL